MKSPFCKLINVIIQSVAKLSFEPNKSFPLTLCSFLFDKNNKPAPEGLPPQKNDIGMRKEKRLILGYSIPQFFVILMVMNTTKATMMKVISATRKPPMPNTCDITLTAYVEVFHALNC
jgi:hypothetical protein